jgi:putative endonuclease
MAEARADAWIPAFAGMTRDFFLLSSPGLTGRSMIQQALWMTYYVYILGSQKNGTLYIGVTNDLIRRTYEHRAGVVEGFTDRYGVHLLVYFEETENIEAAIQREKRLKKWRRDWKIKLIEKANPNWEDLYPGLT